METVADLLHLHLLETGQSGPAPRSGSSSSPAASETRQELTAAAADLQECARDLATVARDRDHGRLTPADAVLAEDAAAWSREATALARRIREAVAPRDQPPA